LIIGESQFHHLLLSDNDGVFLPPRKHKNTEKELRHIALAAIPGIFVTLRLSISLCALYILWVSGPRPFAVISVNENTSRLILDKSMEENTKEERGGKY